MKSDTLNLAFASRTAPRIGLPDFQAKNQTSNDLDVSGRRHQKSWFCQGPLIVMPAQTVRFSHLVRISQVAQILILQVAQTFLSVPLR